MRLVFLSCDSLEGFIVDEDLVVKELEKDGHEVTTLSWRAKANWRDFDGVIIRTTWDYMEHSEEFFSTLEEISQHTKLMNSLETVKWNLHKSYLKKFENQGITTLPTLFFKDTEALSIPSAWTCEKVVVKPAVSAGAFKTLVYSLSEISSGKHLEALHSGDWLCQPFLPQITDGEISLVYFNKVFSHALLKVPKKGDFRVQEEFGGDVIPLTPTPELLTLGDKIISRVQEDLLYARVDLVPYEGNYALMELELIEPALYFRTHKDAPTNFIKALYHAQRK